MDHITYACYLLAINKYVVFIAVQALHFQF